jgi:hypothetical protein
MRHFERIEDARGRGRLPDSMIDPRLLLGHDAFEALPKREQYMRLTVYVDAVLAEIVAYRDPEFWSAEDKEQLRRLSEAGLDFMAEIEAEVDPAVIDLSWHCGINFLHECRADCDPTAIGEHVVASVLDGFVRMGKGVYSEAPDVPCFSVRDLLTSGLVRCDPDGGSSSGKQWWSGLSELFEWHYEGRFD